jgi:sec-independent protein translocase protein TatB
MTDSLILMVLALVVFGPRRLPQIGRQIGRLMYEFRKASNDFKFQMEEELRNAEEADRRKKEEERQRSLAALAATEQASVSADPPPAQKSASHEESEGTYSQQYPAETPSSDEKTEESIPRIMPPSVGETVSRPSSSAEPGSQRTSTETRSADSTLPGQETTPAASSNQNPPETSEAAEALNQHG